MKNFIFIFLIVIICGYDSKSKDFFSNEKALANTEDKTNKEVNTLSKTASENKYKAVDTSNGKITGLTYNISDMLSGINYTGSVVAGAKWEDSKGLNLVVITETSEKKDGDSKSKELYGYHYIIKGYEAKLLWQITDFVKKCDFDVTLSYIPNSLLITDLDDNGIGESLFLYKLSCRSDVSPNGLKLMMHEGGKKYAIRGETKIKIGDEPPYGGETKIDPSFDGASKSFLDWAKKQWEKFQMEKY